MHYERYTQDHDIIEAMLKECEVVCVGFQDKNNPYVIPMNYGFSSDDSNLYFYLHSHKDGYKTRIIKNNNKVCLSVYQWKNFADHPYKRRVHDFISVMAFGHIEIIDFSDPAKREEFANAMNRLFKNTNRTKCTDPGQMKELCMLKVTCRWEDVSGKSEHPVRTPEDVPIPDVYNLPEDNTPYDDQDLKESRPKRPVNTEWLGYL